MTMPLLLAALVLLAVAVVALARALVLERRGGRAAPERGSGSAAAPPAAAPAAEEPAARHPSGGASALARDHDFRHLLGLLTHELRTPLGAIIGYEELLIDGLMGELPERALDAVRRIGTSGAQMRHLIDGLADLMLADPEVSLDLEQVDGGSAAAAAATSARALAGGRGVKLEVTIPDLLPQLLTDGTRLAALLDLAIGAAVRASPGATLSLSFSDDGGALGARVERTALDPERDGPAAAERGTISTGAGLRLAMARRLARTLGGDIVLEGAAPTTLLLRVPAARIDGHPTGV